MSTFCILGLKFPSNFPRICLIARFHEKMKVQKFQYFWTGIWKWHCHSWNQHPQICLIAKFCERTKVPKFGTQNDLFGYFLWQRFLKTTVVFKISILTFFYLLNFVKKKKMPKFGTKNAFFGYFWARILKKLLSYLKSASSHLSICKIPRKNQNA